MDQVIRHPIRLLLGFFSLVFIGGCTHPQLLDSGSSPGIRHRLLLPSPASSPAAGNRARQTAKQPINHPASTASAKVSVNITGHWRLGFQANQEKLSSSLEILQSGGSFQGSGVDDQTGNPFKIEGGKIDGSEIVFIKKYDNLNSPPVRYSGKFSMLNDSSYQGPYMAGQYSANLNGGIFSGEWEAAMLPEAASKVASVESTDEGEASRKTAEPSSANPEHAPDLSGKWDVGYEYDFKTIHSIMFLEQDGGKLAGHGVDTGTKERFVIAKGWYHFPHMTIVRTYPKTKRSLIFKAEVSNVRDSDYQGPYLKGKTQGGGDWEAQLVK